MLATIALLLLAPAAPPDSLHKTGLILPTEGQYRKALEEGVSFARYAKGFKGILPPKVDLTSSMPPPHATGQEDQDCVGWAMAYATKSYLEAREAGRRPSSDEHLFSPMYLYSQRSNRDSDDKNGMNPLEAAKILENRGCATWSMMPYDKDKVNDPPDGELILKSFPYQIANHMIVPVTSENIKLMLANNQVVVLSIITTKPFHALKGDAVFSQFDLTEKVGAHAICAVGYDDERRAIRLMNSWGNKWADGGYAWVSYDLFDMDGPMGKEFSSVGLTLIEAPTIEFAPRVARGGDVDGQPGYSWSLEVQGSAKALDEVLSVTYVLPDPITPGVVVRHDAGTRFSVSSKDLSAATIGSPLIFPALITTRSNTQVERMVFIPAGEATAARPRGQATVVIPDVRGGNPAEAALKMIRAGLKPKVSKLRKALPGADVVAGRVSRQHPEPGVRVAKGGNVVLFVTEER